MVGGGEAVNLLDSLKGIGGTYELNRLMGAFGTVAYVLGAHGYLYWWVVMQKHDFSLTEYCIAFPGGLAACVGAIAGAVALKDRNVASAKIIHDTGAVPAKPPAGPSVQPEDVQP